jgi:hypothetical protein
MNKVVVPETRSVDSISVLKVMLIFLLSCIVRRTQYYTKASRYPCDPYFKVTILYALYFVPFFYWRTEDFDDD